MSSRTLSIGCVLVLTGSLTHCGGNAEGGDDDAGGASGSGSHASGGVLGLQFVGGSSNGGATGTGNGGALTMGAGGPISGGQTSVGGSGNGGSTIFVGVPPQPRGGSGSGGEPIFVGVPIEPRGGSTSEGGTSDGIAGYNDGGSNPIEYAGAGGTMGVEPQPGGAGGFDWFVGVPPK